jgi:hypothetical protein
MNQYKKNLYTISIQSSFGTEGFLVILNNEVTQREIKLIHPIHNTMFDFSFSIF